MQMTSISIMDDPGTRPTAPTNDNETVSDVATETSPPTDTDKYVDAAKRDQVAPPDTLPGDVEEPG